MGVNRNLVKISDILINQVAPPGVKSRREQDRCLYIFPGNEFQGALRFGESYRLMDMGHHDFKILLANASLENFLPDHLRVILVHAIGPVLRVNPMEHNDKALDLAGFQQLESGFGNSPVQEGRTAEYGDIGGVFAPGRHELAGFGKDGLPENISEGDEQRY